MTLWDLKGKILEGPVYELLGGSDHDSIKIYCDTHAGEKRGQAEAGTVDLERSTLPSRTHGRSVASPIKGSRP